MRFAARFVPLLATLAGGLECVRRQCRIRLAELARPRSRTAFRKSKVKLPDKLDVNGPNHRWSYKVRGAGTPVIADGRVYAFGFYGETKDVEETLHLSRREDRRETLGASLPDFNSDTTYNRYAIGAPVVDAETGNVYLESTCGVVMAFNRDGKLLWEHSMIEEFGRLTFPNGRTGALVVEGDLVITDGITANWGADGPAAIASTRSTKDRRTLLVLRRREFSRSTALSRRRSTAISAISASFIRARLRKYRVRECAHGRSRCGGSVSPAPE